MEKKKDTRIRGTWRWDDTLRQIVPIVHIQRLARITATTPPRSTQAATRPKLYTGLYL